MNSLQEKFQLTVPPSYDPEDNAPWVDFNSARSTGETGFAHANNASAAAECNTKLNYLPPGMEIDNQKRKRIESMPLCIAGCSDVSADTNPKAFDKGFTRRHMNGTDDQYSGEHMDHFYGEAIDELGNVGFVERNNYLDRE